MPEIDEYLAGLEPAARAALEHVVAVAVAEVPDAVQGISYGMPALRLGGKPLLGVQAAKGHLAVYPFSPAAVDAVRDRLAGFALSKGTIRFSAQVPPPDDVVRDLVRYRAAEITGPR